MYEYKIYLNSQISKYLTQLFTECIRAMLSQIWKFHIKFLSPESPLLAKPPRHESMASTEFPPIYTARNYFQKHSQVDSHTKLASHFWMMQSSTWLSQVPYFGEFQLMVQKTYFGVLLSTYLTNAAIKILHVSQWKNLLLIHSTYLTTIKFHNDNHESCGSLRMHGRNEKFTSHTCLPHGGKYGCSCQFNLIPYIYICVGGCHDNVTRSKISSILQTCFLWF
jgi:hypothetical protein